jgi:hypothetical protein
MHNKDFHNLYSAPDIIVMIKSKWMRWRGHPACMEGKGNTYNVGWKT